MKGIRVKQTNLILEKNIEKATFLYECILENINTKKLIKEIEHGITLPSNMNHKTNVRGEMTDWKYFIYYYKDTPVAFTEFKVFDNKHVLSGQFAWDYENPKLGLGTYATLY